VRYTELCGIWEFRRKRRAAAQKRKWSLLIEASERGGEGLWRIKRSMKKCSEKENVQPHNEKAFHSQKSACGEFCAAERHHSSERDEKRRETDILPGKSKGKDSSLCRNRTSTSSFEGRRAYVRRREAEGPTSNKPREEVRRGQEKVKSSIAFNSRRGEASVQYKLYQLHARKRSWERFRKK